MLRFTAALLLIASASTAHTAAPVPKPPDPAADLKALEGTWKVVTYEVNGKEASDAGDAGPEEVVISAGKTNLLKREEIDLPIKVDPSKTPKAIDVYLIDAMKFRAHVKGIYDLDGDNLKICLPLSTEAERPTKFGSKDFHRLYVLRRKK